MEKFNGNYLFRDDFNHKQLNQRYRFLRTVRSDWYNLTTKPSSLTLQLRPETCAGKENPSFVGFHQPHLFGYAATSMSFTANEENEKSGLLVFQNEHSYYFLCKSIKDGVPVVELYKGTELVTRKQLPLKETDNIQFKIAAKGSEYAFYYAITENNWLLIADHVDGKYLSTKTAGGFVGAVYSMYTTANGKQSANTASFNWFEIKNEDSIYK
jgi:alpha-N-arabinofuranosidase